MSVDVGCAEGHILVEHSNFSTLLKHQGRKSRLDQRSASKASKFRSTFWWLSIHFSSSDCGYKRHMRDTKFYLVLLVNFKSCYGGRYFVHTMIFGYLYFNCEHMSDGDSSSCLLLVSLLICAVHPISRACVVALPFVSHILVSSRNGDDPIACRISCLIDVVEMGIDGFGVYSSVNYNVSPCDIDVLLHKDTKIRPNKEFGFAALKG